MSRQLVPPSHFNNIYMSLIGEAVIEIENAQETIEEVMRSAETSQELTTYYEYFLGHYKRADKLLDIEYQRNMDKINRKDK